MSVLMLDRESRSEYAARRGARRARRITQAAAVVSSRVDIFRPPTAGFESGQCEASRFFVSTALSSPLCEGRDCDVTKGFVLTNWAEKQHAEKERRRIPNQSCRRRRRQDGSSSSSIRPRRNDFRLVCPPRLALSRRFRLTGELTLRPDRRPARADAMAKLRRELRGGSKTRGSGSSRGKKRE